MHKKETENKHIQIANDTMYYIYKHIDTDINIDELAQSFNISKIHFHTIFKKQMGKNIYQTIKSIRLQKASNLLITNSSSTITQIANMCGYSSQTSFIRAFKNKFKQTPTKWRNRGFRTYAKELLSNSKINLDDTKRFDGIEPKIVKTKDQKAYYIRQIGYDMTDIRHTWQKLQAWIYTNNIKEYTQAGLYHDNPLIIPIDKAFYVGAVIPKKNYNLANTNLPHFKISGGLYAVFRITGVHGDILRFMQWAYQEWLPKSGFETITKPAFTIFEQNHYVNESGEFVADFHLPIQYN